MKDMKLLSLVAAIILTLSFKSELSGQTEAAQSRTPIRDSSHALESPPPLATGGGGGRTVIERFDVTGATGTFPQKINLLGEIVGTYYSSDYLSHGFFRTASGVIGTFDPPGASRTGAYAINDFGTVTGQYLDADEAAHGFIRLNDCVSQKEKNCTIITFDAPGAVLGRHTGTLPVSINSEGVVVGSYTDASGESHGFLRSADGSFTSFDAPGPFNGLHTGTYPASINNRGVVTGYFSNLGSSGTGGFIRSADGKISTFLSPTGLSVYPQIINDAGEIAGSLTDSEGNSRGFLREAKGATTVFDAGLYSSSQCCVATNVADMNAFGTAVGSFSDPLFLANGFQRNHDGMLIQFEVPGAGTGPYQGTTVSGINLDAAIVGSYIDKNGITHGFYLFNPNSQ